jgi:hypothetical protein
MTEIVLDITSGEAELARQRRDAAPLIREQGDEIASKRYRVTVTVTFSPAVSAPSSASARRTYVPG